MINSYKCLNCKAILCNIYNNKCIVCKSHSIIKITSTEYKKEVENWQKKMGIKL